MKLFISAITKFIFGIILVGAMLFLPAWTFSYPGAWLFLGVLFIPMLIVGTVLFLRGLALQVTLKDDTGEGNLARIKVISIKIQKLILQPYGIKYRKKRCR